MAAPGSGDFLHELLAANPALPKPSAFLSLDQAQREARTLSRDIFSEWATLKAILERHEEVIRRRWLKRTRDQRKRVLLGAWPDMSAPHRPDFVAFDREEPEPNQGTKYRDAYMFPHINLEDLSDGKNLLLFLNSWGRHYPEAFARADHNSVHLAFMLAIVTPAFINNTTMYLYGQTAPETYGRVVTWDDDDRAFDLMVSGEQPQPGEGLQTLEIQQRILEFLVQCCRLILPDVPQEAFTGPDAPVLPEPEPIAVDPTARPSMFASSSEAPYRLPTRLDLKRLQNLVAAKLSACGDHIWALREDPGYFAETVAELSEHRSERLRDVNGRRHPNEDKPIFWHRVLSFTFSEAYNMWLHWDGLLREIEKVSRLEAQYEGGNQGRLSEDYSDALHHLHERLGALTEMVFNILKDRLAASPPMRHLWTRVPHEPGNPEMRTFTKGKAHNKNKVIWLCSLLTNEDARFKFQLPNLMDELERHVQRDPGQRQLISPLIAGLISDGSLVAEGVRQLNLHPWSRTQDFESVEKQEPIRKAQGEVLSRLQAAMVSLEKSKLSEEGNPSNEFFFYPVEKKRTQQRVNEMRLAEQRLNAFWAKVDTRLMEVPEVRQIWQIVSQGRSVQRTPEWIEPPPQAEQEGASKTSKKTEQPLYEPFVRLRAGDSSRDQDLEIDNSVSTAPKIKVKTRGVPKPELAGQAAATDQEQQQEEGAPQAESGPQFEVNKRAFKVFSTLFATLSQSDHVGETPWTDFLHAMGSIGLIPEKLYGSVWQFTPVSGSADRSIQFHEPHPQGKIPFWTGRRMGRRLNRNFGWAAENFVLKESK